MSDIVDGPSNGQDVDHRRGFLPADIRIEGFADGVFSIAFTLLVLDFRPPTAMAHLGSFLLGQWPRLLAYAISCLLIGLIWANFRAMLLHFGRANRLTVFISMLLLADVAFLPFPTALVADAISRQEGLREAAFLYGLVLTVGGVFFNALWLYEINRTDLKRHTARARRHFGLVSLRFLLGPLSYLVATLVSLEFPYLALLFYVGLIIYYWFPGRVEMVIADGL